MTKNFNSKNYNSENYTNKRNNEPISTLESVTSSEFRHGIDPNESGFISNANDEDVDVVQIKNIDINHN